MDQLLLPMLNSSFEKLELEDLFFNLKKGVDISIPREPYAIEAVLHKKFIRPLTQDFYDWINPKKGVEGIKPSTDDIKEIKAFIGMK